MRPGVATGEGTGMNAWTYAWKGWWHYRAARIGVIAVAAVGAMVLLGSMMSGDSVTESLRKAAAWRTGKAEQILTGGERFFYNELEKQTSGKAAAVLVFQGQATSSGEAGEKVEGRVNFVGVGDEFWGFAPEETKIKLEDDEVAVSEALAERMALKKGSRMVLRMAKPGILSRDAPLSGEGQQVVVIRGTVAKILTAEEFGRFGLETSQVAPLSVFLPRETLQDELELPGRANVLLMGEGASLPGELSLKHYGLSLKKVEAAKETVEVRSERVFIAPKVAEVLKKEFADGHEVLTYLANTLKVGEKETPYSMVTAVDWEAAPFLRGMSTREEIVINNWLAEDLGAKVGDRFSMDYFVVEGGNRLVEKTTEFVIRSVIKMEGLAADRTWMPDFPGVANVESARDWSPGLPLDLKRIRDKDDDYWEKYKGTPKAFVSAQAGRMMWSNRWGDMTGYRIDGLSDKEIEKRLVSKLTPSLVGMKLIDFRKEAMEAAVSPVDFSSLFLMMGFFLIIASLALVVMVFRLNVEQRGEENGLLAAVGISSRKVEFWRLTEAGMSLFVGVLIGGALAVLFCKVVLRLISSIWGGESFHLAVKLGTLASGGLAFMFTGLLAVWYSLRKLRQKSVSMRLTQGGEEEASTKGGSHGRGKAWITVGVLLCLMAIGSMWSFGAQAGFFLGGAGLLLLGLGVLKWRLTGKKGLDALNADSLAGVNVSRRPSRSLTVAGVLAAGVFLVLSVSAFRKNDGGDWKDPQSGAGGFAWWVETSTPMSRPADALGNVEWFGLKEGVVPFRVGAGDQVDCFNLNGSSRPRLLGANLRSMEGRFGKVDWEKFRTHGKHSRSIPALIDQTTLMWVLKKKVGDVLVYEDEYGEAFEVEIVGVLKDSVFQGSLIVDERRLLEKYPSLGGYGLFLVDDENAGDAIKQATADLGGRVMRTSERLASFHGVENTYIAIFNVLGGLGMILASVGLGLVTERNAVERKEELKVLEAVGFSGKARHGLLMKESRTLMYWGLGIGTVAAMLSVIPLLGKTLSLFDLVWMAGLILVMGGVAWLSSWIGLRAVRDE